MSANLVVDLGNTCFMGVSVYGTSILSGSVVSPASGAVVGDGLDMLQANTYTNLFVTGNTSGGQLKVAIQTAPADVSGQYTDPTSGLAALPGAFQSGGILWISSGGAITAGLLNPFVSGQSVASGFFVAQGFQRPQRYARAIVLSGGLGGGPLTVGFISNLKTTGSGGGSSQSPGSGAINV